MWCRERVILASELPIRRTWNTCNVLKSSLITLCSKRRFGSRKGCFIFPKPPAHTFYLKFSINILNNLEFLGETSCFPWRGYLQTRQKRWGWGEVTETILHLLSISLCKNHRILELRVKLFLNFLFLTMKETKVKDHGSLVFKSKMCS